MDGKSLLDISNDYQEYFALLESIDLDELSDAERSQLESFEAQLEEDRDRKLDNIGAFIKDLEARAKSRNEIAKQMASLAKADENKARYLKSMILTFFQIHGLKTINTLRCRITRSQNGGKEPLVIEDIDPTSLPEEFQKVVVTPDTERIREELEAGAVLPFARIAPRGEHVRIG